jgi:hypothetical protein
VVLFLILLIVLLSSTVHFVLFELVVLADEVGSNDISLSSDWEGIEINLLK